MSDDNVVQLVQPGSFSDPLTEVLRNGARSLLAKAVEAEVAETEVIASEVDNTELIDAEPKAEETADEGGTQGNA